tara:strand:+ start:97 stop:246 length:150 start_codon:yes stop_codon:yes gene_type:complete
MKLKNYIKYDEYDIQTACNIATGDDESTGKEVIRVLKIITKEETSTEED